MNLWEIYGLFVAGIILSVIVPIALRWVKTATDTAKKGAIMTTIWTFAGPYIKVAIGSAIVGFLLLLVFLGTSPDLNKLAWYNAVLYGYGWDATLQKIKEALK
jgi:hypothetical protein